MSKNPGITEEIVIRGRSFKKEAFKPRDFEEVEIRDILSALRDIGEIANERLENPPNGKLEDIDTLVNNSSLLYIEGLIRYQLAKQDIEEYGITLDQLDTPSDFLHEKPYIHTYVNCYKIVFLFDFLSEIVWLSNSPENIEQHELDKIANNLRALFILMEPELNGARKHKDKGFERFAFEVWKRMGSKKVSAQQFWNKAISLLNEDQHSGELSFKVSRRAPNGEEKIDIYAIRLESSKSGKPVIKSICESKDIPDGRSKSFGQIKNIWPDLQKKFIQIHSNAQKISA